MQHAMGFVLACYALIGVAVILFPSWVFVIPLMLLMIYEHKYTPLGLLFTAVFALWTNTQTPNLPEQGKTIQGLFTITQKKEKATPFGKITLFKGNVDGTPCYLSLPHNSKHQLKIGFKYFIEAVVKQQKQKQIFIKLKNGTTPIPKKRVFQPILQGRLLAQRWLTKKINSPAFTTPVKQFFSSILNGSIQDHTLLLHFHKLGLAHILAVSGFHFALILRSTERLLSPLLHWKQTKCIQLCLLILLALFFGNSPSVNRTFLMLFLYWTATLTKKYYNPLHILGLSLLIQLALDPLVITTLAFQLSFLCTTGLLFSAPLLNTLKSPIAQSSLKQIPPLFDLHVQCVFSYLHKAFFTNIAVHMLVLPLTLAVWGQISLLQFLANLLLPPLLAGSLYLFMLGLFCPPLNHLNQIYTKYLLQMIYYPPKIFSFTLYCKTSIPLAIIFTSTLIFLALKQTRLTQRI